MIATFPQLDVNVGELSCFYRTRAKLGKDCQVLSVDPLVIGLLYGGEPHLNHGFLEGRDRKLNFVLHSAQKVRSEHSM